MIRYDFTFSDIDTQLLSNAIGIIIVVSNTKYTDIPSIPKYKSKLFIAWYSCTYWNWLVLKLNKVNMIKDNSRLIIEVDKPIFFISVFDLFILTIK